MEDVFTILYVEDNADNRLLVRRVLHANGFRVIEASTALEALDCIHSQEPDLILMDINMPEIDGYTLTSHIRQLPGFDHLPIIALTANVMKRDRELSLNCGCNGYIEKPIDIDTFPKLVASFLDPKQSRGRSADIDTQVQ